MKNVAPLILDIEQENENKCHVHGDDGDYHQHPAVHRHQHDQEEGGEVSDWKFDGDVTNWLEGLKQS